jgi:hypothetical protein
VGSRARRDERTLNDERQVAELAAASDLLEELFTVPPSPKTSLAIYLLEDMRWRAEQRWEATHPGQLG